MSGASALWGAYAESLAQPPDLTVSEWADLHRRLPRETSREHGPWRTDRAPFTRAIMDALGPHDPHRRVATMKGAQIAGTEIGLNAIGYWIQHDPSSILVVCPNLDDARKFSRRRLRPMIESTPIVRKLVGAERSRDSASNTLYREFPGGALILAGAVSPAGLAGNPIRRLVFDDSDMAPGEVGEEGDPLYIASVRTTTYESNAKIYVNGTPKIEGESRIESIMLESDWRRFMLPCPHCSHWDFLTWSGYARFNDLEDGGHFRIAWDDAAGPESAHAICPKCGAQIDESAKEWMLPQGVWHATLPGDGQTVGFHLPGLYSPYGWLSWRRIAGEFVKAKGDPVALRGWVNLRLGETWRRFQDAMKPHRLMDRFERWESEVPAGVGVLVMACDVQDYGLVYLVKGYGKGEESWNVAFGEIMGDPGKEDVWAELDRVRARTFRHVSGREVPIDCCVVDLGGHHPDDVYDYCRPRYSQRVYAIRGGNDPTAELVGKNSRKNKGKVRLWTLGVDSGKDIVYGRLRIEANGPGRVHIPRADEATGRWIWASVEYAAQLTSEVMQRKRDKRRGWTREWKKIRDRNEAWDLEVYALAALRIRAAALGSLEQRAAELALPIPEGGDPQPDDAVRPTKIGGGWVPKRSGWIRG